MKKKNYINHRNFCDIGRIYYLSETKFNSFIPAYEQKKKTFDTRQLSLFNFDKGGF